jgi:hypothetical protein
MALYCLLSGGCSKVPQRQLRQLAVQQTYVCRHSRHGLQADGTGKVVQQWMGFEPLKLTFGHPQRWEA